MYVFFYVFLRFFQNPKKHDFLRFFELLHTFSRTMMHAAVVQGEFLPGPGRVGCGRISVYGQLSSL